MKGYQLQDRYLQVTKINEYNPLDSLEDKKPIWEQNHEFNQDNDD